MIIIDLAGGSGKEGRIKRRKECRERNLTNKDQIEEEGGRGNNKKERLRKMERNFKKRIRMRERRKGEKKEGEEERKNLELTE